MKILLSAIAFLCVCHNNAASQDSTKIVRVASFDSTQSLIRYNFEKNDSLQFVDIFFVGDSLHVNIGRSNMTKAANEFFQLVARSKYMTISGYAIGDSVVIYYGENYWREGVVIEESESGRILVQVLCTECEFEKKFKQYFSAYQLERKPK